MPATSRIVLRGVRYGLANGDPFGPWPLGGVCAVQFKFNHLTEMQIVELPINHYRDVEKMSGPEAA